MNKLHKMKELQSSIFNLVQFFYDNEDKLIKDYMSHLKVLEIDAIYLSGSTFVVLYYNLYSELEQRNFYLNTSEAIEWAVEKGFVL